MAVVSSLVDLLSTLHEVYVKSITYHWNVTGRDFSQHHKFLRKIYEEAQEKVDTVAELIRQNGEKVPTDWHNVSIGGYDNVRGMFSDIGVSLSDVLDKIESVEDADRATNATLDEVATWASKKKWMIEAHF